jgi:hypothetical protein
MGIYPITLTRELSTWFGRTDTPKQQKGPGSQAPFAVAAFFLAQAALNFFRRAALHLGRTVPLARSTAAGRTLSFRSFEISLCRSSISASMARMALSMTTLATSIL